MVLATVKTIVEYMEELAPAAVALPGDSVGLQLGNPDASVTRILVVLDSDSASIEAACSWGAELLVTHHPLFHRALSSIDESSPKGALVAAAIRHRLNIFCAHTNFDVVPHGVSFQLATSLGLSVEEGQVLDPTGNEQLLKLVVFIPVGYEDKVRNALAGAGAGYIGNYSHCTFQTLGMGTFMPGVGTEPFVGVTGRVEKVDEIRLETILPVTRREAIVQAMMEAHPYEEVAYDLYPLALEGKAYGLGLVLTLGKKLNLEQIIDLCRSCLNPSALRYWTPSKKEFKRIALCGGSGGSLVEHAARQGAEIFISGDFRYHDLKNAQYLGLGLIDVGHDATEQPGMVYLKNYLQKCLTAGGYMTEVKTYLPGQSGWSTIIG